jgi:hypothetical protein
MSQKFGGILLNSDLFKGSDEFPVLVSGQIPVILIQLRSNDLVDIRSYSLRKVFEGQFHPILTDSRISNRSEFRKEPLNQGFLQRTDSLVQPRLQLLNCSLNQRLCKFLEFKSDLFLEVNHGVFLSVARSGKSHVVHFRRQLVL